MTRPEKSEFPPFQEKYIALVPDNALKTLNDQLVEFSSYIDSKTEVQLNFAYAPDKWTVKDVIMHIVDTEQIFVYRALSIARGDTQALPGFDQDLFADNLNTKSMSKDYLIKTFQYCRNNSLQLLEQVSEDMWDKSGTMSGYQMSLRAVPFMLAGHLQHHLNILKERYN